MESPKWQTAMEFEDITYKKCNGVNNTLLLDRTLGVVV